MLTSTLRLVRTLGCDFRRRPCWEPAWDFRSSHSRATNAQDENGATPGGWKKRRSEETLWELHITPPFGRLDLTRTGMGHICGCKTLWRTQEVRAVERKEGNTLPIESTRLMGSDNALGRFVYSAFCGADGQVRKYMYVDLIIISLFSAALCERSYKTFRRGLF